MVVIVGCSLNLERVVYGKVRMKKVGRGEVGFYNNFWRSQEVKSWVEIIMVILGFQKEFIFGQEFEGYICLEVFIFCF